MSMETSNAGRAGRVTLPRLDGLQDGDRGSWTATERPTAILAARGGHRGVLHAVKDYMHRQRRRLSGPPAEAVHVRHVLPVVLAHLGERVEARHSTSIAPSDRPVTKGL